MLLNSDGLDLFVYTMVIDLPYVSSVGNICVRIIILWVCANYT